MTRTKKMDKMNSASSGHLVEVVFSFDTTGSMREELKTIRLYVPYIIQRLQAEIPRIRIAIIAHSDYSEAINNYVTKFVNFTNNYNRLCRFVQNVEKTRGPGFEACYELVLHQIHKELSWKRDSQKILILIGDANPHKPNFPGNNLRLDWRKETDVLAEKGVKIYAFECRSHPRISEFYQTLAEKTGGMHLKELDDFDTVSDYIIQDYKGQCVPDDEKMEQDATKIFNPPAAKSDTPKVPSKRARTTKKVKKTSLLTKVSKKSITKKAKTRIVKSRPLSK